MNCANHPQASVAAYCRTCGKALCEECKRDVMGAIYCEPCIAARLQGGAAPASVPLAQTPTNSPNPAVAAMLGFIPGVGAMYNGQFFKALIHVMIVGSLIVLQNHTGFAGPLFGLLTMFFWFYMVFDAYKTAKNRLMGLPAPDLLGLDRMFGIQESAPPTPPDAPVSAGSGSDLPGTPGAVPPGRGDRGPTGAVVLIGLGVFFLLGNMGLLRVHDMWPVLLIGLGLWIAFKRTVGAAPRSNG
jgi:hypothetical protein